MNKTISINIGGRNFFVEEKAFAELDAYLDSIKGYFAKFTGGQEIVADMENRIAEKFSEKDKDGVQAVVTLPDVEGLIKELGTVEELSKEEGAKSEEVPKSRAESLAPKRLMRNTDDAILAGVCSGIAAYFGFDTTLVRLAFVLLIFAWGAIVPIYLVLWLVMPEAKTTTEKMQMRGTPLTVNSLKQTIKERAQEVKNNSGSTRRGLSLFASRLADIIKALVKLAVRIAGIAIVVLGALATAGLTFVAAIALFNVHSPYLSFPLTVIANNPVYFTLVVAAYFLVLIPVIFLMLLGVSVFRNRNAISSAAGLSLLGIWMLALIGGGVLAIDAVPGYVEKIKNSPEMQVTTKTFEPGAFSSVKLSGNYEYHLIEGNTYSVKASGRQASLDEIGVSNNNGTLEIRYMDKLKVCVFCLSGDNVVEITAPSFSNISATDAAWIRSDSLTATNTTISLSRASSANIKVTGENLNLSLDQASRFRPTGNVKTLSATVDHASSLEGLGLTAENATINLLHASHAKVNITGRLKYSGDISSHLDYIGQPVTDVSYPASGKIRQLPWPQPGIPNDYQE